MRTHRTLTTIALVLVALTALVGMSLAQCGGHGQGGGRMGPGGPAALKPAFTTEQQAQMEKIKTKYGDQRVELHNKMAAIRLEMKDLLSQPEPDFGKVEAKIDAISGLRAKLAKMRLQQHVEVRAILTPEQRMLFDRGFADRCDDGPGCGMACGQAAGGAAMGCAGKAGAGGPMDCGGKMGGGAQAMGCAAKMGGGAMPAGCAATCKMMGAGSSGPAATGGCPMMGGAGPVRGVRPQTGEWRRWL